VVEQAWPDAIFPLSACTLLELGPLRLAGGMCPVLRGAAANKAHGAADSAGDTPDPVIAHEPPKVVQVCRPRSPGLAQHRRHIASVGKRCAHANVGHWAGTGPALGSLVAARA
jgi:hypothetical protein